MPVAYRYCRGSARRRWLRCQRQSLQGQNGGIAAVDGRTGEGDGRFGGYRSVAIIQLDVETDGRTGVPAVASFAERTGLTERFDR